MTSLEEKKRREKKKGKEGVGKVGCLPLFEEHNHFRNLPLSPLLDLLYILFLLLSDSAYISTEYRHIEKYRGEAKKELVYVQKIEQRVIQQETMSLVSAVPARKERRAADKRTTKSTSRPSSAHGVVGNTSVPAPVPSTPRSTNRVSTSRTSSIISNESRASKRFSSVYHTSDEPLSKEALYRAKLKYGVYESPAKGPSSSHPISSRTAAANAASSTVGDNNREKAVVDAYKRLIDAEPSSKHANSTTRGQRASAAASKAYANSSTSNQPVVVSPQKRMSSQSQTYSIASRTSSIVSNGSTPVNFQKIMRGAEGRAEQRMKNRSDPERKNFSYGLRTEPSSTTSSNSNNNNNKLLNLSHEAMNNLMARATTDARAAEAKRSNAKPRSSPFSSSSPSLAVSAGLGTGKSTLAESTSFALNAAVATKDMESKTAMMNPELVRSEAEMAKLEAAKKRALLSRALDSQRVLAIARQNVERKIKSIEESQAYDLYDNDTYNRAAVGIAKANFKQKQNDAALAKVNMGGGLWMTPQDINLISQNLLSPLLGEINERTTAQRAKDEELAKRTAAYQTAMENWNNLQLEKIENDSRYPEDNKEMRAKLDQDARDTAERRWNRMVEMMENKLNTRLQTYRDNKQKFEDVKTEIDMKLEMDQRRADKEISRWSRHQRRDLKAALVEQQELLQPFLDDVKKAEQEHDDLLREYGDINEEIHRLQESIAQHKEKIEEYTKHLEEEKEREAREASELKQLEENKESMETDLNENVIVRANKAREEAALSAEQVRLKELEIESMINERRTELSKAEINLQRERLSLLDAMKGEAELSGNDKLNEEKVKSLVGTSSEEFLKKTRNDPAFHLEEHASVDGVEKGEGEEGEEEEEEEHRDLNTIKEEDEAERLTKASLSLTKSEDHDTTKGTEEKIEPELDEESENGDKEPVEPGVIEEENDTTEEGQAEVAENPKEIVQEPETADVPETPEEPKIEEKKKSDGEPEPPAEASNPTVPASKDKVDNDSLTPSFSGFSQGSMSSSDDEDDEEEEEDEDEEDIRTDDVSGSQPKDSFLKEVF